MKSIQGNGSSGHLERGNFLYGESLNSQIHFYHITYSKFNDLWYVKEVFGPTYSVHTSKEGALREARELAYDDENGQVILHRTDGLLEIVSKFPVH